MTLNQNIARIFYDLADILEIQAVKWKPQAYRKAARYIETLQKNLGDIYGAGGIKSLEELPGIGEGIAKKIAQFIETGKVNEYEQLKKSLPKGLPELLEVESLGPKRAKVLYQKLKIKSIQELKKAIEKHLIAKLPGFGEKSEQNILASLAMKLQAKRILLAEALPLAEQIISELKASKLVDHISEAGSVRRRKETIGDLDILVTSKHPKKVMDYFTSLENVRRVLAKGETKSAVVFDNGLQVDIRVLPDKVFGAALQYFTGSVPHNIILRNLAIKKGYKLSEYGLFLRKTNKFVAGKTEEEIYAKLGLKTPEPELRENAGEILAAQQNKLPKLVSPADIRGDFHVHSEWSDGAEPIEVLAKEAIKLGYKFIAITDHSKTRKMAGGLSEHELHEQMKEIDNLNKKFKGFKILKGSEVDILGDGSLDFSDEVLSKLDIVIGSIHSGFKSSEEQMTERICRALQNKYLTILGHPTGRLIQEREPYALNTQKVLDTAKKCNKALEINAFPSRLDLNDINIRQAVEKGCKLALGTDAHSAEQLVFMQYGVMQARRGWCGKKNLMNC